MTACAKCERLTVARGLCRKHYLQAWRSGALEAAPTRARDKVTCPPDHPHDLDTCWGGHGCRCTRCVHLRKMDRQRRRNRLRAYGRGDQVKAPRTDAAPVRAHILTLREAGIGLERLADAAQVPRSALLDVMYGRRGAQRKTGQVSTVAASVATRVLAVDVANVDAALYPATGTVRRLRALVAIGYQETFLAERLGWQVSNFSHLLLGRRRQVRAETYRAVRELFAELWSRPMEGRRADRSRLIARRRGWVGPLGWDDIDDPDETPNVTGEAVEPVEVDEMAVELAVAGERVRLRPAERRAAVTRLHAMRWSDQRIAAHLGCADRTVYRIREELGLEAFEYAELVKERVA